MDENDSPKAFHHFHLDWDEFQLYKLSEFLRIAKQDLDSVLEMVKDPHTRTFESHQQAYDHLREIGDRLTRNADSLWGVEEEKEIDEDEPDFL